MKVYRSISSLTKKIQEIKKQGKAIGLVPTMGFLHEGHMSLIRRARKDTDCVIVSIFVNPAQFGPKEDFRKYPRDMKKDLELCEKEAADIIFAPEAREMYPEGFATYVKVERITDTLCGASRPGHFRGVATVVAKLFNITMPDIAYFGQKDGQQAAVIRRMAKDLDMPVKIKVEPIVREKDGLAMSSRNVYLNPEERVQALCIYKSLKLAQRLFNKGERDSKEIIKRMSQLINENRKADIDYVSIVDTEELRDMKRISGQAMVTVAVRIGNTRLIDNIILN
ncbi:MAG: pantoate--beta-alanine ligase [Candidatus Omnitrophota bacterium]